MDAKTIAQLIEYFDFKQFFTDNPPMRLLILLALMGLFWGIARFICSLVQKKLEKMAARRYNVSPESKELASGAKFMDAMDFTLFEKVIKNVKRLLYLVVFFWASRQIILGPLYAEIVSIVFTTLCIWAGIEFFAAFVPFNIDLYLRRHGTTLKESQSRSLLPIVKGVIWAIGLTFLLDNLGLHVSTIIAGLGIVGVAVGLAGQAILADFFSYIVILLDKPFRIGDFVLLPGGKAGSVEFLGPKTTHLRSLEDDLIVCANSEMTKGILVNQGSIHERVVILKLGVAYDTPVEVLKQLPDILKEVVNSFPQCSFDRACLLEFGDSNLMIQLLYLVSEQRGGLRDFMNTRSQVNVAILERFQNEGINIAFPTEHVLFTDEDLPKSGEAKKSAAPSPKGSALGTAARAMASAVGRAMAGKGGKDNSANGGNSHEKQDHQN